LKTIPLGVIKVYGKRYAAMGRVWDPIFAAGTFTASSGQRNSIPYGAIVYLLRMQCQTDNVSPFWAKLSVGYGAATNLEGYLYAYTQNHPLTKEIPFYMFPDISSSSDTRNVEIVAYHRHTAAVSLRCGVVYLEPLKESV